MPSGSAITADLEKIMQRQQKDLERRQKNVTPEEPPKPVTPPPPVPESPKKAGLFRGKKPAEPEPEQPAEEDPAEEVEGSYQKQKMRPPQPKPNMLNQEIAEAAAKQFKKKEKKIQKACAKLDNPEPEKAKCSDSCIIL